MRGSPDERERIGRLRDMRCRLGATSYRGVRIRGPLDPPEDALDVRGILHILAFCALAAFIINDCTDDGLVLWFRTAFGP